jgi:hypothetical protein
MTALHRRSVLLLCLVALGAAGMFLRLDGGSGIDIAWVGSAVFYAALWLLLIHLSKNPEGALPADPSLAERLAWSSALFSTLIWFHWLNYIAALPSLGAGADQLSNPASRAFGLSLAQILFAWIVVSLVLRSGNREAVELDERDLRIQNEAGRAGSGLMAVLIIGLITALATQPELLSPWLRPLVVANALIGLLVAKGATENVYSVIRYRLQHA